MEEILICCLPFGSQLRSFWTSFGVVSIISDFWDIIVSENNCCGAFLVGGLLIIITWLLASVCSSDCCIERQLVNDFDNRGSQPINNFCPSMPSTDWNRWSTSTKKRGVGQCNKQRMNSFPRCTDNVDLQSYTEEGMDCYNGAHATPSTEQGIRVKDRKYQRFEYKVYSNNPSCDKDAKKLCTKSCNTKPCKTVITKDQSCQTATESRKSCESSYKSSKKKCGDRTKPKPCCDSQTQSESETTLSMPKCSKKREKYTCGKGDCGKIKTEKQSSCDDSLGYSSFIRPLMCESEKSCKRKRSCRSSCKSSSKDFLCTSTVAMVNAICKNIRSNYGIAFLTLVGLLSTTAALSDGSFSATQLKESWNGPLSMLLGSIIFIAPFVGKCDDQLRIVTFILTMFTGFLLENLGGKCGLFSAKSYSNPPLDPSLGEKFIGTIQGTANAGSCKSTSEDNCAFFVMMISLIALSVTVIHSTFTSRWRKRDAEQLLSLIKCP